MIYTPALEQQQRLQAGTTRARTSSACLERFLGQIRKKSEAVGSNPAVSGLLFLLPWASWSTALADPLLKHRMLVHVPKAQPSTEGRARLPWSSSLPRVLSLPKPRAPPHTRRKREGRAELCRNPPKPEQNKALGNLLLRLGPPTHMKAAFFWANYTGCSEPPGTIRAAKADIKGLPILI